MRTLFPRWQNCRGFRLPLGRGWQIELWHCPRGTVIPLHVHRHVAGWILNLWGKVRWRVGDKARVVWGPVRRRVTAGHLALAAHAIPAGIEHGAEVLGPSAWFLNLEHILMPGVISPAYDFEIV